MKFEVWRSAAPKQREIKSLINNSVEKVDSGSRLVADAGNTMTEIVASVQRVTDIIGEITAAAAEQSSGIDQVSRAVADLDQMTQQNAALVEQSAAAAQSLKDQSEQLISALAGFRFNGSVRAPQTRPKAAASRVIRQARRAAPASSGASTATPRSAAAASSSSTRSHSGNSSAHWQTHWQTF